MTVGGDLVAFLRDVGDQFRFAPGDVPEDEKRGTGPMFPQKGKDLRRVAGHATLERVPRGADTFLFYKDIATNKVDTGRDTIWDFDAQTDFLEIDTGMVTDFTNVAAFIADHAQTTRGGDVKITFDDHNSVTLKDTTVASLLANQDHFHFV